jgi:hypothetical protein
MRTTLLCYAQRFFFFCISNDSTKSRSFTVFRSERCNYQVLGLKKETRNVSITVRHRMFSAGRLRTRYCWSLRNATIADLFDRIAWRGLCMLEFYFVLWYQPLSTPNREQFGITVVNREFAMLLGARNFIHSECINILMPSVFDV